MNEISCLNQYVKKLHHLSGQFNLYVGLYYTNNTNAKGLMLYINNIKQLVADIENEINNLSA